MCNISSSLISKWSSEIHITDLWMRKDSCWNVSEARSSRLFDVKFFISLCILKKISLIELDSLVWSSQLKHFRKRLWRWLLVLILQYFNSFFFFLISVWDMNRRSEATTSFKINWKTSVIIIIIIMITAWSTQIALLWLSRTKKNRSIMQSFKT